VSKELQAAAIPWWEQDQDRLAAEQAAMHAVAPDLLWRFENSGGWSGHVPLWPFRRRRPTGLAAFVGWKPFEVRITCGHAYPMIEPRVWPEQLWLPKIALGWTNWHLLPSGALCLLQDGSSWDPSAHTADLIQKISGWYLEYHLMLRRRIKRMTECGIAEDDSLDKLLLPGCDPPDR
jgi:hypothetical protein